MTPRGAIAAPAPDEVVAAPGAGGVQLAQGSYDLALRFDLPRAQEIEWRLHCPGVELTGAAGEPFERYRERRIVELQRQRERDRQRVASVTSALVGALAPRATASTRVATPAGEAQVDATATVNADAVGQAAAHGAISHEPIELAPGDVGAGMVGAKVHVLTTADGACTLDAITDDPAVRASFQVTRIRDLQAEARAQRLAIAGQAGMARTQLSAHLVALGADPSIRQRRIDAARAERQAKLDAQAEIRMKARLDAELRLRAVREREDSLRAAAYLQRTELVHYFVGKCNADPNRRDRLADAERARREALLTASARLAARLDAESLRVRGYVRGYLVALGAKERPPRPAPLPEVPGPEPFPGAVWIVGHWTWTQVEWRWTPGGWSDPGRFGDAGGEVRVVGGGEVGGEAIADPYGLIVAPVIETHLRDHRRAPDSRIRDHRDGAGASIRDRDHRDDAAVRDHRDRGGSSSSSSSSVRDHRSEARPVPPPPRSDRGSSSSTVRDHRDRDQRDRDQRDRDRDSKRDDDDRSRVRDHRR